MCCQNPRITNNGNLGIINFFSCITWYSRVSHYWSTARTCATLDISKETFSHSQTPESIIQVPRPFMFKAVGPGLRWTSTTPHQILSTSLWNPRHFEKPSFQVQRSSHPTQSHVFHSPSLQELYHLCMFHGPNQHPLCRCIATGIVFPVHLIFVMSCQG